MPHQPTILAPVPPHATFLFLDRHHEVPASDALQDLAALDIEGLVVGLGSTLLSALGKAIPGFRPMPQIFGEGIATPCTPSDVCIRIEGGDPGEVLHRERAVTAALESWEVTDSVDAFMYRDSRDLTGYEDGTENPKGDDAIAAAFRSNQGPGIDGSSVLAVQRWVHDLQVFDAMSREAQDHTFGRNRETNEELDDAPPSAHVKRTAQEDFEPEAFTLRRSMPWRDSRGAGLVFVSFSATLDPYEAQLRRMMGQDDGIVDNLFQFTRPVTGATFWCPPIVDGALDLRAITS